MSDDRPPPVTDADYRLVRGPWPRWAHRMSLLSLALWTGAVVTVCIAATLIVFTLATAD